MKTFLLSVLVFLAVVAAWSRISTMKETPGYIDNFTKALANLYKGAFGQ